MNIKRNITIAVLCALFIFSPNLLAGDGKTISKINIHFGDTITKNVSEDTVRRVIPFIEGDGFTSQKLDQALDHLRKWGVFETIEVSTKSVANNIEIDFYLNEAIKIGQIDIFGNYPYIEPKIRKYLTIRPGDIYTYNRIKDQIKKIKDFYEREGFFNTKVTAEQIWSENNKDARVIFKIKRGDLLRFGNIVVNGSKAYPKGRVVSAINPLRPYQPRRFNQAIRDVTEFYHLHGFSKTKIKVAKKELDIESGKVNVVIDVSEGSKTIVKFRNNKAISSRRLKKIISIFREGSVDEYEIDISRNKIANYHHEHGYPDVKVTSKREVEEDGKIVVTFFIDQGKKQRIYSIDIDGNKQIFDVKIQRQIKTKVLSLTNQGLYNEDVLNDDLKSIKRFYDSKGYVDSKVGIPEVEVKRSQVEITIPVHEDIQTVVDQIVFEGNDSIETKKLLKAIKNQPNDPPDATELKNDKQALLVLYADNGHPYAEIKQTVEKDIVDGQSWAIIRYEVAEGPLVKIGKVIVVGNSLTSSNAIRKAMALKEGDSFSYEKLIESQLSLRRLGSFNTVSVDTIGFEEQEEVIHLRVKVEEQKPFVIDFELTYSTDDSYGGSMNFTNLNSFGLAKQSHLKLTGGRELSRAEIGWTDPRFVGSGLEFSASTWLQYEDKNIYNYMQAGGGYAFVRRYHRTSFLAKHTLERNYFLEGSSTAADADSLRDNTISKITLSGSFDSRNSFSSPTNGLYAMMSMDIYNEIEGIKANFIKFRWIFGHYYTFWKRFTLTNTLRMSRIQGLGNNVSIPTNELIFMGGDDTLRGFSEDSLGPVDVAGNPTGGRNRWIYNSELQVRLFKNWQWALFYDMGSLTNELKDIGLSTIRHGAGTGVRYITPVGPMRLDYGFILDRMTGEHVGRLHFTFGYVF